MEDQRNAQETQLDGSQLSNGLSEQAGTGEPGSQAEASQEVPFSAASRGPLDADKVAVSDDPEDDFPEYANEANKELHRKVQQKKREIREMLERIEDIRERCRAMEEHAQSIGVEIRHSEEANAVRQEEIASEEHFSLLLARQGGKASGELRVAEGRAACLREKLNDAQQKVFENNQRIEKTRLEINWNQEEMDQWLLAARQKEDDRLALERYQRADESKVKELNLSIEKLTASRGRLEGELEREVTETQALQIQLNKMAEEFREETEDRHRLFEHWDSVLRHVASKNAAQVEVAGKVTEARQRNAEAAKKAADLKSLYQKELAEVNSRQEEIGRVERTVLQRKEKIKELSGLEHDAKANLRILQNRVSAFASELERRKRSLLALEGDLTTKQKRLAIVESGFHKENRLFQEGQVTEKQLEAMAANSEARLKEKEKEFGEFLKSLSAKKHEFYQSQKELYRLKQLQSTLVAETAGLVTKIKNMAAYSARKYAQIQQQQELLYNAEYQIQLLERKVARAQGEKTLEETDFLNEEIRSARELRARAVEKLSATSAAMKQLGDEHRALDKKTKSLEEEERRCTVLVEKINLENDMTAAELTAVVNRKEGVLVQNNIMRLEVRKLQDRVVLGHSSVLDLEARKGQLELSMKVREKEVGLHHTVLQTELRLAEQERHKAAVELAERRTRVKNLHIKYQSLIQSKQGDVDVADHSQAYYVIKAAQEKEELERRADELKAQIAKSEFEFRALMNTLDHLKARNQKFREQQLSRGAATGDIQLRQNLQEQFTAIGAALVERKHTFEELKAQIEGGQQFQKELSSRLEIMKASRREKQSLLISARNEAQEQSEKAERALKACAKNQSLLEKKRLSVDSSSLELCLLQQTVLESYLKALNSLVLFAY